MKEFEQHQLVKGKLLNGDGELAEAGYATSLIKEYSRKDIKVHPCRIKEWDYYYIGDDTFGIALTIDDNGYMGLASVSVLDYQNKKDITKSYITWFEFGKVNLPYSSTDGNSVMKRKCFDMNFFNINGKRHLLCDMKNVSKGKDFHCDIFLEETTPYSMVIATPFHKKKHFYYNQKINNLKASGYFTLGDFRYEFNNVDAYGVLDWGRGVWTYNNTWYWSSLSRPHNGHTIGFNLGYGFGDTSKASENMLFYDDKVFKLNDVKFEIPKKKNGKDDFLSPWKFSSVNKDINLTFTPILDRKSNTNAILIQSDQHQVFGRFSGYFLTSEGKIEIKNLLGFAEKVRNRW